MKLKMKILCFVLSFVTTLILSALSNASDSEMLIIFILVYQGLEKEGLK